MDIAAALALALSAVLIARAPRRLFAQAAGRPVRADRWLMIGLLLVGLAAFESHIGGALAERAVFALALQILAAVAYADLRFLVIPDLYSGLLALLAVAHAWNIDAWPDAAVGAVVCGGMLAVVALAFRRLRGVDGIGWGDVKLAVGLGGLLGPLWGVRAVAAAAVCAALAAAAVLAIRRRQGKSEPLLAPFGAALALACAGAYAWSLA